MKEPLPHRGIAAPFKGDNIDTDQIIPSREMKRVSKVGLAAGLFSGRRYLYDGKIKLGPNPEFVLNISPYQDATILLSGKNFGCGSSREHAVWALIEYGFKAVIAESFGKIFRNNSIRNGLLPIALSARQIECLTTEAASDPANNRIAVDLHNRQVISPSGQILDFELDDFYQKMLLEGIDFIDMTMQVSDQIDRFIKTDRKTRSWAHL